MKKLLLAAIIAFMVVSVSAQTQTNAQRRKMNAKVLQTIETYEASNAIHNEDAKYQFESLFKDMNVPVFCDILGHPSFRKEMPASQYVDYFMKHSKITRSVIKNVRIGNSSFKDGKWAVPVTLDRSLVVVDANNVLFSSSEFFEGKDYAVTLNLIYNPTDNSCYIADIKGSIDSPITFPEGQLLVVQHSSPYDNDIFNGTEKLKFNSFEQAFATSDKITSGRIDFIMKADTLSKTENYACVKYNYKKINWRAKVRFSIAPMSAYKVNFNWGNPSIGSAKSSAMEYGMDLGYSFPLGKHSKLGLWAGFAMSSSNVSFTSSSISYEIETSDASVDPQNTYTRKYNINKASEGLKFTDFVVPVYLEGEHRLARAIALVWNVGVKIYLNNKTDVNSEPYTVDGSVTANGTTTSISGIYTNFLDAGSYTRKSIDFSAMANLGFDINICKERLYGFVTAGYEMGFAPSFDPGRNAWYSPSENFYPFVPNNGKDIARCSFINSTSYTRNAFWINVGLKLKF